MTPLRTSQISDLFIKALTGRWHSTQPLSRSPSAKCSSQQGLSILECLIAVGVLALTAGLVLPPLVIAAATRVQTRRAEQALQLAQGEVDRIRILVERNEHRIANLPPAIAANTLDLEGVNAPTATFNRLKTPTNTCNNRYAGEPVPANRALMIDVDGDCNADFMMQVFRTPGSLTQTEALLGQQGRPSEFRVGVRVYSIAAGRGNATQQYRQPGQALTGLQERPASLSLTSGEQNQLQRPLAVLYTRMSWGERDSTLCDYFGDRRNELDSCQDTF